MQYALTELFERRDGRVLTLDAYREIGGVSGRARPPGRGALRGARRRRARRRLGSCSCASSRWARGPRTPGAGCRARRSPRSTSISRRWRRVLDTYGASRQLSFDRDARDRRADGRARARGDAHGVAAAAPVDRRRAGRPPDRAPAGRRRARLDRGRPRPVVPAHRGHVSSRPRRWEAGSGLAVTPEEREYLEASRAERDRRHADEQARAEHEQELERRSFRRLRALVAVLAVAALDRGRAHGVRDEPARAGAERRSGGRSRASSRPRRSRTSTSIRSGASSWRSRRSIGRAPSAATAPGGGGSAPPGGDRLADRASRSRASAARSTGALEGVFVTEGKENEGIVDIRDAATGDRVAPPWDGHDADINDVQFSRTARCWRPAGEDGALKIWDPATGEPAVERHGRGPGLRAVLQRRRVARVGLLAGRGDGPDRRSVDGEGHDTDPGGRGLPLRDGARCPTAGRSPSRPGTSRS